MEKKIEYYLCKPNKTALSGHKLLEHELLTRLTEHVSQYSKLTQRYNQRFHGIPEMHMFENLKKDQFLLEFLHFFSNDDQLRDFMKLVLKVCSLKCMYCQLDLVLMNTNACYLIKIPCFGILVDQEMLRLKIALFKNNDGFYKFKFLTNLNEAIEKSVKGPKSNLWDLNKTTRPKRKSSLSSLFSKCSFFK